MTGFSMHGDGLLPDGAAMARGDCGFLIVGGAEKAGTTSLYGYLAAHPEVCASLSKETDYFRRANPDRDQYLEQFPPIADGQRLRLESSPGYLAEAEVVAPAIARVVPDAMLAFVLRDPIDRLRSCHRFYLSRLHLPAETSADAFAELCLLYDRDAEAARRSGIATWHLNALARGRYESALAEFKKHLPDSRIMLIDYRDLSRDPREVVQRIAAFCGVDPGFFARYVFERENVSFTARSRLLQRVAVAVNDRLQPVWRRYPAVKRRLLSAYKSLNATRAGPSDFGPGTLAHLREFYEPTYAFLATAFDRSPDKPSKPAV